MHRPSNSSVFFSPEMHGRTLEFKKISKEEENGWVVETFSLFFLNFFSNRMSLISLIIVVWFFLLLLKIKSSLLISLLLCQSLVDPLWLIYWSRLNFRFKFWGNCLLSLCYADHLFDGLLVIHFCTWALRTCTSSLPGIPLRRTLRRLVEQLAAARTSTSISAHQARDVTHLCDVRNKCTNYY